MPRYLDPKNDLVFKKIFPTENVPELPNVEKRSIVDVRCYDQYQRHFIVEMQMAFTKHFMQRLLYNVTSVYNATN